MTTMRRTFKAQMVLEAHLSASRAQPRSAESPGSGIKFLPILNYVPCIRGEVKRLLHDELGGRDDASKHLESVYTRFFQSYILPRKFGIDKRKAHFSNLTMAGQMTREKALAATEALPCRSGDLEEDHTYVGRKLRVNRDEFAEIMAARPKSFADYPNNAYLWRNFSSVVRFARRWAIGGA